MNESVAATTSQVLEETVSEMSAAAAYAGSAPSGVSPAQVSQFQELVAGLYQCCQDRLAYQSRHFELPEAELKCLLLFGRERYLTAGSIGRDLNVAKSRVSKLVDGLAAKGLVRRTQDPDDARIALLSLTPEGRDLRHRVEAFQAELHRAVLEQLPGRERRSFLGMLGQLKESMDSVRARFETSEAVE